jgi:hypothetical protein
LEDYLLSEGIHHQATILHTLEQNGVAERTNRSMMEKTRCMLQGADLSKGFWEDATEAAVCLKNRSPHRSVRGATPDEKWTGKPPVLSQLRVFGCTAYVLIPKENRKKLEAKSKPYIFLWYCENSKGYKRADPSCPKKQIKARDVVFPEDRFNSENRQQKVVSSSQLEPPAVSVDQLLSPEGGDAQSVISEDLQEAKILDTMERGSENEPVESEADADADVKRRCPQRQDRPKKFPDYELCHTVCAPSEPQTVAEALSSGESCKWRAAIQRGHLWAK